MSHGALYPRVATLLHSCLPCMRRLVSPSSPLLPHLPAGTGRRGPRAAVLAVLLRAGVALAAIGGGAVASGCSSAEGTGPTAAPASIRIQGGNDQNGAAGASLTVPLAVVVTDARGGPVSGVRVEWDATAGSGTLSPAASLTDRNGVATTTWTLGTLAGTGRVTAGVSGVNPAVFTAIIQPGAAAVVVATPPLAFVNVGETVAVRASVRDAFGNELQNQTVTFGTLDPAVATVSATGVVSALAVGNARIVATAGARADTVPVTVQAAGSSLCGPIAPRVLALGETLIPTAGPTGVTACLEAPAGVNAEYAIAIVSSAPGFGTSTSVDVFAQGNTAPTTASLVIPEGTATPVDAAPVSSVPAKVEQERRQRVDAELAGLTPAARDWYEGSGLSVPRTAAVRAEAKVGDLLRLNANGIQGCSNADTRVGRVAAVGTTAIIVSDTANPTGGYTDADYAGIVATFDTLIYPLDTTAFGAPTKIGAQGKIILFYTRNVNALTPPNAGYTIGGFFYSRDLYPRTARNGLPGCEASNEAEMLYLLVPDPNGVVNGNRRSKNEITLLNLGTLAHELQHLINASRRLYITPNAATSEETWLDEGLSHIAEELLYLRISGFTSRQNLNLADVTRVTGNFTNYASQNFSRFYSYLVNPEGTSPYAPNDSLSTRGAIWSFLRFVAGRQGAAGESAFFRALVNSPTTGFANLSNATGGQIGDYLRDWAVSNIADDFSAATTAALDPSYRSWAWNFRSIFPGLRFGNAPPIGVYPINARALQPATAQRITLAGGTSSYVRFGVAGGGRALVSIAANGGAVPSHVRYAIVRLR